MISTYHKKRFVVNRGFLNFAGLSLYCKFVFLVGKHPIFWVEQ